MEQTKEDLENIKSKLIEHISKTYDKEKAKSLINSIRAMNDDEFIDFLKEQGLIGEESKKTPCIFCSIIFGDIPSSKIGENDGGIAILDINPASLGHSLVVPKEHIESSKDLPGEVGKLALQIKEKLEKTFEPKRVDIVSSNVMGHEIINLVPVYKNETISSERKKLSPEELERIKEKIDKTEISEEESDHEEKNPETSIKTEEINEKNTWLPKRRP
ncbi:MAG: HIT domain-containing protein [archaeon]|nr:HIT domain-containing protein [archaeon]